MTARMLDSEPGSEQEHYLAAQGGSIDEHLQVVLWQVGHPAVCRIIHVSLKGIDIGQDTIMVAAQAHKGVGGHVQQVALGVAPGAGARQALC